VSALSDLKSSVEERLKASEHFVESLEGELRGTKSALEEKEAKLEEYMERLLCLEHDAGSEFRGKIRLLERHKADLEGTVKSLETQLQAAKEHSEQYKTMSEEYEQQLQESNTTYSQFK